MRPLRCARTTLIALAALLQACGGGGGGGGSSAQATGSDSAASTDNVQPIHVGAGPANNVNWLLTSVTICTPGNSNQCQTIDDVLVDTGSYGLRIMASTLNSNVAPTTVRNNANVPLAECMQFADGFTWGSVQQVDVRIAGKTAANIPIQLIGDRSYPTVPSGCQNTGNDNSSVAEFGANGVLGVGVFREDCGSGCASIANNGIYYACNGSVCSNSTATLATQVRNPIGAFGSDNNGVIIDLPAVPDQGAANIGGSMIFGIGTRSNNALGNASVLDVDPTRGTFTTLAPGQAFPLSFIDSGSNGLFFPYGAAFPSSALPTCTQPPAPGFFCPPTPLNFSATQQAYSNGRNVAVGFSIGNANALLGNNPAFLAFNNLGAPIPSSFASSFDWGLPFYFGRRVYTALENTSTPSGFGPYVAF